MDWISSLCLAILAFFGSWLPSDSDTWLGRGHALAAKEQYDQAIEAFSKAIRLDRSWPTNPIVKNYGSR